MRDLAIDLLRVRGCRLLFTLALAIAMSAGAAPARAQDLFGLFRLMFQPAVRVPAAPPYDYRTAPHLQHRVLPRRPKVVRADPAPTKPPLKPKPLGEVTNPVPELLADSTLRRGDIVMFPDGPRVFMGQARSQHALADFEPISHNAKTVPPTTRKLLAHLRPGWNGAWAAETPAGGGRIAAASDVDSTGSIKRRRR
jgi:hypothetical protein